jgi:hypothetical protein
MPRIAVDWAMPPETRAELEGAVRRNRWMKYAALAAGAVAVLCMPIGLRSESVAQWLLTLTLWMFSLVVAMRLRRRAQAQQNRAIARAQDLFAEHERLEANAVVPLRVAPEEGLQTVASSGKKTSIAVEAMDPQETEYPEPIRTIER